MPTAFNQRTRIIVPCYNERRRLPMDRFLAYAGTHADVGFIFVDDGSTDGTGQVLADMQAHLPGQIVVLALNRNRGKAEAVRQGMNAALPDAPEWIGFWDADLATPLAAVDDMLTLIAERKADMVLGARVKLMGCTIVRSALRHYFGRIYATFASTVLDLPVYDTQCGAKLFRVTDRLKAVFALPFIVNWTFDVEILARFRILAGANWTAWSQQAVVELPLAEWIDQAGSKVGFCAAWQAPVELVRIAATLHCPSKASGYRQRLMDSLLSRG